MKDPKSAGAVGAFRVTSTATFASSVDAMPGRGRARGQGFLPAHDLTARRCWVTQPSF